MIESGKEVSGTNASHSKRKHVYVILRFDDDARAMAERVTATKVLMSEEEARREVERLNELNSSKAVLYTAQISRYVETHSEAET